MGLLVQGPQAGQTLVDLGAEVIKVELPLMGDMARWIPISMEDLRTPYFEACNRGKRSITVDLRVPKGAEIFRKLVDSADVLLANFKPGTLEAWGLGYEELSQSNPGLVYAMGSTFGPEGEGSQREAMSPRWQAVTAAWLCSEEAAKVTGRCFDVRGDQIGISEGWVLGPTGTQPEDPQDLGPLMTELMSKARLNANMGGHPSGGTGRPENEI